MRGSWGEMSISSPVEKTRVVWYHMYDGGNSRATTHSPRRRQVSLLAGGHGCLSPPHLVHTPWRSLGSAGESVGCCRSAPQCSSGWSASRSWDEEAIHTSRMCQHADEDGDKRHSDLWRPHVSMTGRARPSNGLGARCWLRDLGK